MQPLPWLEDFAARHAARYEPEADDRWLNSWEPFVTLRVSERYDHSLSKTTATGSRTLAWCILQAPGGGHVATWLMIAQDDRLQGHAAATSDLRSPFFEPVIAMPRIRSGNPAFDHAFAAHAESLEELQQAFGPSVQKLLLSWQLPVHVEVRPGGLILAPVTLAFDLPRLEWLWQQPSLFAEKAAKHRPTG